MSSDHRDRRGFYYYFVFHLIEISFYLYGNRLRNTYLSSGWGARIFSLNMAAGRASLFITKGEAKRDPGQQKYAILTCNVQPSKAKVGL